MPQCNPAFCHNLERKSGARGFLRIATSRLPMIISARPRAYSPGSAGTVRAGPRIINTVCGFEGSNCLTFRRRCQNISRRPRSSYGPCAHGRIDASLEANSTVAIRLSSTQQLRLFRQRNTSQLAFFGGCREANREEASPIQAARVIGSRNHARGSCRACLFAPHATTRESARFSLPASPFCRACCPAATDGRQPPATTGA